MRKSLLAASAALFAFSGPAFAQPVPISNLPPAALPLSGSELMPCSQGGVTKACMAGSITSYTAPYTGASPRTLTSKLNDMLSVKDFGATGNGTTDDTAAMTAALQTAATACRDIYVPAGTYLLSNTAQMSINIPNNCHLSIVGAGRDSATLNFSAGGGIIINLANRYSSVDVTDMTFATGVSNGTGTGLELLGPSTNANGPAVSVLENLTFRGSDGYNVTDYWNVGISIRDQANVNFISDTLQGTPARLGTGVILSGIAPSFSTQYNFIGDSFNNNGVGLSYGTFVQGVSITASNFTGPNTCIMVPSGETGLSELNVVNSQFACFSDAINVASEVDGVALIGNLFLLPAGANGTTGNMVDFSISGNQYSGPGATSSNTVIIINGGGIGTISGNVIGGENIGVWLQSNSTNVNVQANTYVNVTTNVRNDGTGNTVGVATP